MISRSQMNRQFYNMGGEGIMQMAPQQMQDPQQMQAPQQMQDPQQMQQADAEQYRPIADSLSQDPKKALAMLIKMLIEQGVPPEEARKIAMEMIQGVAQGGMEEVSDDNRIEARFGGRMGYASGGIGRLVDREQYGFGSVFKSVGKAVSGAVKGVTSAVKSVASSKLGRIALTIAAGYYLGPAGLNIGSGMGAVAGGAMRAGLANLAVQAASGQKINFGEALTAGALGGITGGLTQGQTGVTGTESMGAGGVQLNPLYNDLQYTPMDSVTSMGAGGVDMNAVYNDMGYTSSNITPSGVNMSSVYEDLTPAKTSSGIMDTLKSSGTKIFDVAKDYGTQALDFAKNNKLLTAGTIAAGASLLSPKIPEQLPGESMEEYNARVEQWKTTLNANLGNTPGNPYLMPASANNPYYGVQAANGGRIGYGFGGIGSVAAKMDSGDIPAFKNKGFGGMFGQLIANNPQIFKQVQPQANNIQQIAKQSFFNPNMNQEEDTRYKLPASARNPMYGMMANGGRMGYAYGNSVQEGIMAAPQIANQMGMPVGNPRQNQSGVSELDYRDQGGFVPPIGIKEKEDDIPAMLSNNEFVFTADAVKNAGGGDPNVGAQKMYAMMKQLENGGMA
jgi:hypothetical protein